MSRQWILSFILISLTGCGVMEPLVHAPSNAGEAVVKPYDLSLYKRSVHTFDAEPIDQRVEQLLLEPRVERLVVLVDLQKHGGKTYRGVPFDIYTLEIVRRFNETLPASAFSTQIYQVGPISTYQDADTTVSSREERRRYINTPDLIPSLGPSIEASINNLADRLSSQTSSYAVVTFAPWEELTPTVVDAYDRLNQRFLNPIGSSITPEEELWSSRHNLERLCVYQIGIGNRMPRSKLDKRFGCGSSEAADLIAQADDMAAFVERAMYKGPRDTDKDGIFDYVDMCPATVVGRLVDYQGCLKF